MNRKEFQIFHGFSDADMDLITAAKAVFKGRVTRIWGRQEGRWEPGSNAGDAVKSGQER